jgi:hypothetical protein
MANNVLIKYGTRQTLTITGVASLASDTNRLAGIETSVIDNTTDGFEDFIFSGKFKVASSGLTDKRQIEVWAVAWDGSGWPDVFDGTNSAETITSLDIKNAICFPIVTMATNNTGDRVYHFSGRSARAAFLGGLPSKFVLFVVHDTNAAFSATAGDHEISYYGVYPQIQS